MKYHLQEPLFSQVYRTEVEPTSTVRIHKIFWIQGWAGSKSKYRKFGDDQSTDQMATGI